MEIWLGFAFLAQVLALAFRSAADRSGGDESLEAGLSLLFQWVALVLLVIVIGVYFAYAWPAGGAGEVIT